MGGTIFNSHSNNGDTKPKESPKNGTKISPKKVAANIKFSNNSTQTISFHSPIEHTAVQTSEDKEINQLKQNMNTLKSNNEKQTKELEKALSLVQQRNKENLVLSTDKMNLEADVQHLRATLSHKDKLNDKLRYEIDNLKTELENVRAQQIVDLRQRKETLNGETQSLVNTLKQLENDKAVVVAEYNELLNSEREEYAKNIKELNVRYLELKTKLDR